MEEWKEYKISDVCKIRHGFAFKGAYFTNEKQPYICVTPGNFDIKGGFKLSKPKYYHGPIPNDYILNKDDLIVTMTDLSKDGDTLGYSAIIPQIRDITFLHNQRIGLVESIASNISKHFLYWVMRTPEYQKYIVNCCSGSTVKHTSPKLIGTYVFKAPDPETQEEIASLLNNLDAKIELNRRINDNLEQQAQALFKSWFVDFEPFKDGKLVDSELGMIPEGWRVGNLLDIAKLYDAKRKPLSSRERENMKKIYPYYGATSIMDYVDKYIFDGTYLLMGEDGSVMDDKGYPYLQYVFGKFWSNNHAHVMQGKNNFSTEMLHCLLLKKNISPIVTGAVQAKISQANMRKILITQPPHEITIIFSSHIKPIYEIRKKNELENQRLSILRDTLLPKLMSGKLKINDINN